MSTPVAGALARPSLIDYPGRIAVVLFLAGCNLRCGYCHNSDLWSRENTTLTPEELDRTLREAREEWADGAVLTGGEPTVHPGLPGLVRLLRERGFRVKLDTNGTRPAVLSALLGDLEYVAMDYKASLSAYAEVARAPVDTDAVLASVRLLSESRVSHEFRVTLVERIHTREMLTEMARELPVGSRIAIQPFVPREGLPDPSLSRLPRTSPDFLREAARLFRQNGRNVEVRGALPLEEKPA